MADEKHGFQQEYAQDSPQPGEEKINLSNNISARIKNPLQGKTQGELFEDVEAFTAQYGLQDITDLVKKGALVAQNPAEFENVSGLTDDERNVLRDEVVHKWRYVSS